MRLPVITELYKQSDSEALRILEVSIVSQDACVPLPGVLEETAGSGHSVKH